MKGVSMTTKTTNPPTRVEFGALVPQLYEQFKGVRASDGYLLTRSRLRFLQKCADGVTLLSIGQLLPESEVRKARKRILKRIEDTFFKKGWR